METHGLFQKEDHFVEKYKSILKSGGIDTERDNLIVSEITNEYISLLNQMKKLIKISDVVQGKMKSALHSTSEILEEINNDLITAQKLQTYFIRDNSVLNTGHRHSHIYLPSKTIGGDFINIDTNGSSQSIIIADVEGHGITAALVTGVLKSAFSMLVCEFGDSPALFLEKMNLHLYKMIKTKYATCYYAYIDTEAETINLAKAGHHHPFFWSRETDSLIDITATGPGLGIIPDALYKTCLIPYQKGDKILFFTDGIIEQRNSEGEMYTVESLKDSFLRAIKSKSTDIIKTVFEDVGIFSETQPADDDITMLLYEF